MNSFEAGGDGGGPSECDKQYHSDDTPVVALSTGWFDHKSRCHNNITITANGRSVAAMVVDECDSTMGCDEVHDYQPPFDNNIVDASKVVWKALGVPEDNWGWIELHGLIMLSFHIIFLRTKISSLVLLLFKYMEVCSLADFL
ncbi:ripening-related protein 1 [Populus alba x Populus x berolinensis]|nr:ripening-related protein 1 [Populus alba x Populus x berolinensis]